MKSKKLLLFFWLLTTSFASWSSEYAIGDTLPNAQFEDQFAHAVVVNNETRWLVFTRSMAGAEVAQEALAGVTTEQLTKAHMSYVADISGMPSLIFKLVALPKMQDLSYSIALDREGELTKYYPVADGTAALLDLKEMQLTQIRYFDKASALKDALQPLLSR
ncbi:hypothetical protein L9G74_17960 [Shewanella sp. C32]|uniref:FAD/FMN-containing dehydrogenase n=1 Tax=Shewanella electrica TaxID=515560 RepID=A0ABT2FPQ9_9GAMM|nr:hypothetical protein [Shewanella electrica]MCH1926768.1 hypothetical protein [Shewanella electrica]MCS4558329.1 hypothetical protein [Shewanella electrica]